MKTRGVSPLSGYWLSGVLLGGMAVLLTLAVCLARAKLLKNAHNLGMALAHSYALEEELHLASLEAHLHLASQYLDELVEEGQGVQAIQGWLESYYRKLTGIVGQELVDVYAVVEGQIIAANPWEGDWDYPFAQTDWYAQALEAEGEAVLGDVYLDAVTGERIFTLSQALGQPGNVMAMDIDVKSQTLHNSIQTLPEGCSYFLCDERGTLIYCKTDSQEDEERFQPYVDHVLEGIADGSLLSYDASVVDTNGVSRGIYYQGMDNGWTVIMTIPIQSILMGEQNAVIHLMAVLALALFGVLVFWTIYGAVKSRVLQKADSTIRILGDSFCSIYRVRVGEGRYETIQNRGKLWDGLPERGAYAALLAAVGDVIQPGGTGELGAEFSLEEIRRRIRQGVTDYGGDYPCRLGEQVRWINLRTLYHRELAGDEVIFCARDVDEEKRRALHNTLLLQDALAAAEQSTRTKSEFFSRMSHEMRTPLNVIIGCCGLAEKRFAEGELAAGWGYMKKIRVAGHQLLELINDILELSKVEAGQAQLDRRALDLKQLLWETGDLFRDRIEEEGKHLAIQVDGEDTWVLGDEKKLTQIVNNLLSNAVKYTRPGDRIRLEARPFFLPGRSKYQIVVADTGVGMSQGFLERLFDPYARETDFHAQPAPGTGLGMPIVKSLLQQMDGEIRVDSRLGEGTRVAVTLPLEAAAGHRAPEPLPEQWEETAWKGRRVLVAEDHPINREILTELLTQLGMEPVAAADGAQAVELFSAAAPGSIDAILMDIQMPVLDGCQAARAIRGLEREDARRVPIVAVTANAFAEDIARTMQAGMNDHISKPIDGARLKRTLAKLFSP